MRTIFRYRPASNATSFSGTTLIRILSAQSHMMPIGIVMVHRKYTIRCVWSPTSFFLPDPYACAHKVSRLVARPWLEVFGVRTSLWASDRSSKTGPGSYPTPKTSLTTEVRRRIRKALLRKDNSLYGISCDVGRHTCQAHSSKLDFANVTYREYAGNGQGILK